MADNKDRKFIISIDPASTDGTNFTRGQEITFKIEVRNVIDNELPSRRLGNDKFITFRCDSLDPNEFKITLNRRGDQSVKIKEDAAEGPVKINVTEKTERTKNCDKYIVEWKDGFDTSASTQTEGKLSAPVKVWTIAFMEEKPSPSDNEDHGGQFFPGDHLIFKIKVSDSPTKNEKGKVCIYRPNQKKSFFEENYQIASGASGQENIIIHVDPNKFKELPSQDETLTAKIDVLEGNCTSEKEADRRDMSFTLTPLPEVRLRRENPIEGKNTYQKGESEQEPSWESSEKKKLNPEYYRLYSGTKYQLNLYRAAAPAKLTTKVTLKGACLKANVQIEFEEGKKNQLVDIELKPATDRSKVSFVAIDACEKGRIASQHNFVNILPAFDYICPDEDWIIPKNALCSLKDQIWFRLSRNGAREFKELDPAPNNKLGAFFATVECDAFENNSDGTKKYKVLFKKPGENSEYVTAKYPPDAKKGGIRIDASAANKKYPITIEAIKDVQIDNQTWSTCKIYGKQPEIHVLKRFAYFSATHNLDDVLPGTNEVPITVNLAVPARTKTSLLVGGPYCSNTYKIDFSVGQDSLTFNVDFDFRPHPYEPLSLKILPFSGNLFLAETEEDIQSYPPEIIKDKGDLYAGFDKYDKIIGDYSYRKVGRVELPTFAENNKVKLKVTLFKLENRGDRLEAVETKAWEDDTIVRIRSEAFGREIDTEKGIDWENIYEVIFNKGETSKEVEVQFRNAEEAGADIRFEPTRFKYLRDENNQISSTATNMKAIIAVGQKLAAPDTQQSDLVHTLRVVVDPLPQCVFGKLVTENAEARNEIDEDNWIDSLEDLPFVVGEKSQLNIALLKPNKTGRDLKGQVVSPVIKGKPEFTIPKDKSKPNIPVEVEFQEEDTSLTKKHFNINRSKEHWGAHPIWIEPVVKKKETPGFVYIGKTKCSVQVYKRRNVSFHPHFRIEPDGPYVKDDTATIRIQLNHPAPMAGASVKLTGPFDVLRYKAFGSEIPFPEDLPLPPQIVAQLPKEAPPQQLPPPPRDILPLRIIDNRPFERPPAINGGIIEIKPGYDFREVVVKFNKSVDETSNNVKLESPVKGCEIIKDGLKTLTALIKTPKVELDQAAWDELPETRKVLTPGTTASLPFMLDNLCPASGCEVTLECELFTEHKPPEQIQKTRKYRLRFSDDFNRDGKNHITIDIPIDPAQKEQIPENGKVKIKLSDNLRCELKNTEVEVDAAEAPMVSFADGNGVTYDSSSEKPKDELKPTSGAFFETGTEGKDKASIYLQPNRNVHENIRVKLKSSAFGATIYSTSIPKDTEANKKIKVDITFTIGKKKSAQGSVPASIIYMETPEGWITDPDHGELFVRVAAPEDTETVVGCPRASKPQDEILQERARKKPTIEEYPEKDYCNLRRLFLTVRHGNHEDKPCDRGPFKNGCFEVVNNPKSAEHKDKALICTSIRAPILQVTGSHPSGDPHVEDSEKSKHFTQIIVGMDEDSDFCTHNFILDEKPCIHPFLFVADRSLHQDDAKKRESSEAFFFDSSYRDLLGPPPDPAPVSSLIRRTQENRYDWAPLLPTPDIDLNKPKELMILPVYRAHNTMDARVREEESEDRQATPSGKQERRGMATNWFKDLRAATKNRGRGKPHQYLIEAQDCGFPDPDSPYGPAKNLRSIVEVYPADEFCFYIGNELDGAVMEELEEGKFISPGKEFDPSTGFNIEGAIRPVKEIQAGSQAEASELGFVKTADEVVDFQDEDPEDIQPAEGEEAGGVRSSRRPQEDSGDQDDATFHTRMVKMDDGKFKIDPLKPPSRVWHPYKTAGEAQSDAEFTFTELECKNVSPTGAWDPPDDPDVHSEALSDALGSGCLTMVADLEIHIGRNGNAFDPDSSQMIRKALHTIVSAILMIVEALNNKDNSVEVTYGWGFSCKLTFLQGHFVRYWGWKECSDHRVFWWNYNEINMKLLGIEAEILFGVGVAAGPLKAEAVLFGSIGITIDIKRTFEKLEPAAETAGYVDEYLSFNTEAKLGFRIVLGAECILSIEGAVKTGYTFRIHTTTNLGIEFEVYFNGLSVYIEIKFLGIFDKKAEKTLIKGNVAGWPQASFTFGGKGDRRMTYVRRSISQGRARIDYFKSRYEGYLRKYQELQVLMVADKKIPGGKKYPLSVCPPGYCFREDADFLTENEWKANKTKFDIQWDDCRQAFVREDHRVRRRRHSIGKNPELKERLNRKESEINRLLNTVFIPKLRDLDALEKRIENLQERINRTIERVGEENLDTHETKRFLDEAEKLKENDVINYRKISGSRFGNPLKELEMHIRGLQFYALKRKHW